MAAVCPASGCGDGSSADEVVAGDACCSAGAVSPLADEDEPASVPEVAAELPGPACVPDGEVAPGVSASSDEAASELLAGVGVAVEPAGAVVAGLALVSLDPGWAVAALSAPACGPDGEVAPGASASSDEAASELLAGVGVAVEPAGAVVAGLALVSLDPGWAVAALSAPACVPDGEVAPGASASSDEAASELLAGVGVTVEPAGAVVAESDDADVGLSAPACAVDVGALVPLVEELSAPVLLAGGAALLGVGVWFDVPGSSDEDVSALVLLAFDEDWMAEGL